MRYSATPRTSSAPTRPAWNATIGGIVGATLDDLASFETRVDLYRASVGKVSDQARIWVAEQAGEIVATAVCTRVSPSAVELRDLYVAPPAWGTGVAKTLMEEAIESVRGDATESVLWVGEANARARRFYEREGWTTDGASRSSSLGPTELRYRRPIAV